MLFYANWRIKNTLKDLVVRELSRKEVKEVSGGLSADAGGLAITALSITAAGIGSPFIAAAGLTIGLGLLLRKL